MGHCPDDYAFVQAAKYYEVAPWELMPQSIWWVDRALFYMTAEVQAQKIMQENQQNRQ